MAQTILATEKQVSYINYLASVQKAFDDKTIADFKARAPKFTKAVASKVIDLLKDMKHATQAYYSDYWDLSTWSNSWDELCDIMGY